VATYPPNFDVNLMLCDSVAAVQGKLYILGGGWDEIQTAAFPFHQSRIGLAALIRVPWTETNKIQRFEIKLEDEDGKILRLGPDPESAAAPSAIEGQFNIGRPATIQQGDSQVIPVAMNLDRQHFSAAGTYTVVFSINGEEKVRLPVRVSLMGGFSARLAS
jgi:hypothetical protein